MAKPGAGMNQMAAQQQMGQMAGRAQPGQQMPQMQGQANSWASAIGSGAQALPGMMGPQTQNAMQYLQRGIPQQGGMPPQGPANYSSITANMPMRGNTGIMGGMNPMSQAIQRQGANPAYQNAVMNKLRPTMESNQNVQPLQNTNPQRANMGQAMAQAQARRQMGSFGRG